MRGRFTFLLSYVAISLITKISMCNFFENAQRFSNISLAIDSDITCTLYCTFPLSSAVSIRSLGGVTAKTLCLSAVQNSSLHYNVHSLYGHTEAIATMRLKKTVYSSALQI